MHDSPAAIDPLLRLTAPLAAVAPVNVPLHVLLAFAGARHLHARRQRVTESDVRQRRPPFGLVMVKLSVEVPPTAMLVGENALLIVGGPTTATVLLQELFASLVSGTLPLGSTPQAAARGVAVAAAAVALAVKLTSKEPGAAMVTGPLAVQVRVLDGDVAGDGAGDAF